MNSLHSPLHTRMGAFLILGFFSHFASGAEIAGFRKSAWMNEQVREVGFKEGFRVLVQAPLDFDPAKTTCLVFYATPNGNTLEQTLGCAMGKGLDWRFDIQHVSAQIRRLRELHPKENIVIACLEAQGLSWPAWKRSHPDGPKIIQAAVNRIRAWIPGKENLLTLSGHSGGGSFLFGYLDGTESIPSDVRRIIFLDANYSYSNDSGHGNKLLAWVKNDPKNQLVVIAYDDREIVLDGKKVIGPDGGTFRATDRMFNRFSQDLPFKRSHTDPFLYRVAENGQIHLIVHTNPENKILHTALVGEMNGMLHGMTLGDPLAAWGKWGGPRAYAQAIQPAPTVPNRPDRARGGSELFKEWEDVPRAQREEAILGEILAGNFPTFLRRWFRITYKAKGKSGKEYEISIDTMPDYLAVGDDRDFVRVPINPITASQIADAFGCTLPTRFLVEKIHTQAKEALAPIPLTKKREDATTFLEHHRLIENQRQNSGERVLISGIKKDVVLTNLLEEKANRVAIYGWHQKDGKPIQPLNTSHVNWYVDYSHGVRLLRRTVLIDGKPRDIRQAFLSDEYAPCFSDEGILRWMTY